RRLPGGLRHDDQQLRDCRPYRRRPRKPHLHGDLPFGRGGGHADRGDLLVGPDGDLAWRDCRLFAISQRRRIVSMRRVLLGCVVFISYLFILVPNIVVILGSFGEKFYLDFPPTGFTLSWYEQALRDKQAFAALWFSMEVAFWTALLD